MLAVFAAFLTAQNIWRCGYMTPQDWKQIFILNLWGKKGQKTFPKPKAQKTMKISLAIFYYYFA